MSCTNPSLLYVADIRKGVKSTLGYRDRLEKLGFKFNEDKTKAYRFAAKDSKNIPLESLEDWKSFKIIELPCGSCLSCRMDYSSDWAIRCQFEAKLWQNNYFLTLTYDDEHLCYGPKGNPTLVKDHIADFIKALRNYFYNRGFKGIRYLLCGEYNSSGERMLNPHYHLILFNCPIPDLTLKFPSPDGKGFIHKINSMGTPMFFSPLISDIWSKGFITIDDANYNTEAYVSRYIMKKQKGQSGLIYYDSFGVIPPFLRMSNRPGIGYNQFLLEKDKYLIDPYVILPGLKPKISGLPKYFRRSLYQFDSSLKDKFESQAKNKEAMNRTIRKYHQTTSNEQKAIKDSHLEKLSSVFSRSFD